jgi:hypothetical protein
VSLNLSFGTAFNIPIYLKINQIDYSPNNWWARYTTEGFESTI